MTVPTHAEDRQTDSPHDLQPILVWDWPTRLGHWLMAACFVTAYVTGDSEEWRLVHVMAGGGLAGIIVFRLLWGFIGSRHARFIDFIDTPLAAWGYLKSQLTDQPQHFTGHNPAGGYAVLFLLVLGLFAVMTGWPLYQELGEGWAEEVLEELHEGVVNFMLFIVLVHLAGVAVGSFAHRENLPRAMLTGFKLGKANEAIASARLWAVPLLIACAVGAGWWLSR